MYPFAQLVSISVKLPPPELEVDEPPELDDEDDVSPPELEVDEPPEVDELDELEEIPIPEELHPPPPPPPELELDELELEDVDDELLEAAYPYP
jgi:hypothetical protein